MGLTLKDTGASFELCPEGTHQARCYIIADLGTQADTYDGENRLIQKIFIVWELAELMKDGRPFSISKKYTNSFGVKANIRKDLEAWRGRPFTEQEIQGFNLKNALGQSCFINISNQRTKTGKDFSKIMSIMSLPKGVPPLAPVNDMVYLDLDDYDPHAFQALPEWIQKMVRQSPEYQALSFANDDVPPMVDDGYFESDIPF